MERSGLRYRALEGHVAAGQASVSGISLHLVPADAAYRCARSVCLSENTAAGFGRPRRHDLVFPFNMRRLVGVWKLLFFHGRPFVPDATKSAQLNRGAYLVNAPGHCAECHSPRNFLGAVVDRQRFAGGPAPEGKGWVPNITPTGLQHHDPAWSEKDIASFLGDGMTPSGDFAGGAMADVVRNLEQIDKADRDAMATYIYALPAREGPTRPAKRPQKP